MELDDLLKKATTKPTPDSYQLTTKEQLLLLKETLCEVTSKPGREVEVFLRFKKASDIKKILNDPAIRKVYHRVKADYLNSLVENTEDYVKLATKMKDVDDWKIVATVECYNKQRCRNCQGSEIQYTGTFQILQHKKYWDRRNLVRLDEQLASIHETKMIRTDEDIVACHSCRKFLDSSNIEKEYGSLFKGLKG